MSNNSLFFFSAALVVANPDVNFLHPNKQGHYNLLGICCEHLEMKFEYVPIQQQWLAFYQAYNSIKSQTKKLSKIKSAVTLQTITK